MQKKRRYYFIALFGLLVAASVWLMRTTPNTPVLSQKSEYPDAGFRDWQLAESQDVNKGIKLAKARRQFMETLIRSNPEQAMKEALTLSEWTALPQEIQAHVETPFSTLASVEVLIGCGTHTGHRSISTEVPGVGSLETFVYGRRTSQTTKTGIPVQGIRIGGISVLHENIFQPLNAADEAAALQRYPVVIADRDSESVASLAGGQIFYFKSRAALDEANKRLAELEGLPGPATGTQALFANIEALIDDGEIDFDALELLADEAAEEWSGTPRNMVVLMVDFSDLPGQPTDPAALSNTINTVVSEQIQHMSYGKTHIIGTVHTNTYRVSQASSSYIDTLLTYPNASILYDEAVALAEADGYDLSGYDTVCIYFSQIPGMEYSGLGSVGGSKLWINGTTSAKTIAHELGHNYGALHANAWEATNTNPVDPSGEEVGYGDFTDIMGTGLMPAGHFNSRHKKQVGWLEPENWLTATTSGTHRIYRSDHWETTGALRGLEISKGTGEQYWIGLRQEQDLYETFSRGVYVLWKQPADDETLLLDMSPQSAGGIYDGGLALGRTYSDTAAAVHITPIARGGQTPNEWMDIAVNLGPFPGNSAPSATLDGPATTALGSSVLFTVTASDADGDELAYFWDTGDGLVKPNDSSISAAWLSGTTATVSCVVSDRKGGSVTVSKNIVLSGPLDNWTQRTSGTTADLYDVAQGGGTVVAVGDNGHITYSSNGTDWTHKDVGDPYFIGITHDGSQFVAVGDDYDDGLYSGAVYTTPDGSTWTRRMLSGETLNDVAYGNGVYVAVGRSGTIVRSTDGISWSSVASGTTTDLQGVSYGDNTFVIVGDSWSATPHVVLSSTNGLAWTDESSGVNILSTDWLFEVEYLNDRFLAGGWSSSVQHSTDQGNSFQTTMNSDYEMLGFAYAAGTYFAAGAYTSDIDDDINLVSLDGVNWSEISTTDKDLQQSAVSFEGSFITVGLNGSIWQSGSLTSSGSGFAIWQLENADELGPDRDPLDDADFDGHINLIEYAMGTSASDAGVVPALQPGESPEGYFQVCCARNGAVVDVEYAVERASSLASNDWSAANTVTLIDHDTNLTVRSVFPMSTQSSEFMRLNVELKSEY